MPSHSYILTLGNIEFHLPIIFPLSWASEVFLQGQSVMKWIYVPIQETVVCGQANGRPDNIRQIVYKDKEQDRT